MANELQQLLQQLKTLRLQEDNLIQRIDTLSRASPQVQNNNQSLSGIQIGDSVSFKSTNTTSGGQGTVIGFTKGNKLFAKVKRTNGPFKGFQVRRLPSNLEKLSPGH